MTIRALFFAHYQDIAGQRERDISLPEGATVRDLVGALERRFPGMAGLLVYGRMAVNAEFAEAGTVLRDGDEVACMPPMSGGAASGGAL